MVADEQGVQHNCEQSISEVSLKEMSAGLTAQ